MPHVEVEYFWTGGITGANYRLQVWSDDRLVESGLFVRSPGVWTAPRSELAPLRTLVNSIEFRALAPRYVGTRNCCDLRSYTIEVTRNESRQRVETDDTATRPAVLDQVLRELERVSALIPRTGS
jgi:hypothetical protein